MNKTELLNKLIKDHSYTSYLEIGVDNPNSNYYKIISPQKECCDPYDGHTEDGSFFDIKEYLTYNMTSDQMF